MFINLFQAYIAVCTYKYNNLIALVFTQKNSKIIICAFFIYSQSWKAETFTN